MACKKYLVYNATNGYWSGTQCGGSSTSGIIIGGIGGYTDCLQEGTLSTSPGTIVLSSSDVCVDLTPTPTKIGCGQGVTDTNYYYTDCCGNFVQGTTSGQIVSLNYQLPYQGIKILDVATTQICQTPTTTPTSTLTPSPTLTASPTITPSVSSSPTPTLTPSPTPTPAVRYINDCQVITIFPMGVECNVIKNPTSSSSFDGVLSVNVTGGTAPYNFYWNTGERTQTIYNAPAGNYTILVVDYYGDFSSTTICSLVAPTSTPTPTPTITMTPTPSLSLTNLCLTFVTPSSSVYQELPLTFTPSGSWAGRPTWYNAAQNLTIRWIGSESRWEISNWPYGGVPVSNSQSFIPSLGWVILGTPNPYATIISTLGTCPTYTPLTLDVQTTNVKCNTPGICDGSMIVSTQGGVAPYYYSIDGVNYQTSNIFTNLCSTTYGLIVKDSNGNQLTQSVVIGYDNSPTIYTVSLVVDSETTLNSRTKELKWHLEVNPTLPLGTTLQFDLNINSTQQKQGPFNLNPNNTMTIQSTNTISLNNIPQILNLTSNVQTLPNVCSPSNLEMEQTNVSQNKLNLTYSNGDVFSGTSVSFIDVFNPNTEFGCISTGVQNILVSLQNVVLPGNTCALASYIQRPIGILNHNVVGTIGTRVCASYELSPTSPYGMTVEYEDCNGNYITFTYTSQGYVCAIEGTLNITNGTGIIINQGSCS